MVPITPLGDAAVVVQTPLARELLDDLTARPPAGLEEAVPALQVLTVYFDPLRTEFEVLRDELQARLDALRPQPVTEARELVIPVIYDGPDLAWVADRAGLGVPELTRRHADARYEVAFLGFTPGFGFLTGTPPELRMPRLDTPRARVPAGSVALGGPWAGVYPLDSPGGWRLIGRTEIKLFDPAREPAILLRPGDAVRFEPA